MLNRQEAQRIVEKAVKLSTFPEFAISIDWSEATSVRFANNAVTTSGFTVSRSATIACAREGREGRYETDDLTDEGLRAAVRRAEEIAESAHPDPEHMAPLGPQQYADRENWSERTAAARPPRMIREIQAIVDSAGRAKLVAAGFFRAQASCSAIASKAGLFGYCRSTDSGLSTTLRNPQGSSSGWSSRQAVDIAELSGAALGEIAADKCLRWNKPVRLEPGKYTVVLEPAAVAGLLGPLAVPLNARLAEEGRSFLSRKGGGTLLGEKLFSGLVTLRSDPFDRRFPTLLWDTDGLPASPVTWVEKGVVKNLHCTRYWAAKTGKPATAFPRTIVMEGGGARSADLIRSVDRGLLVTRFFYIRVVNPQTVQVTGVTRDGLFLIEKGEVTGPVVNFRFNESPVRMLANVRQLGQAERADGESGTTAVHMIVPSLVVDQFTMSSVSDAV
ncbi:MAG: TldD/PmbA family protein [Bryobacterales bacterium]|nr:TldD/PmbA family protein [Bryobacterales bacterium]